MKQNILLSTVIALTAITTAFGCGSKDRSLDDFNKQKAQEDYAKLTPAAGRYSGVLYDTKNNTLGGFEIILTPTMTNTAGTNGSAGVAAASLQATITYQNQTSQTFTTGDNPNYDDSTGTYTATITIATTSGASAASSSSSSSSAAGASGAAGGGSPGQKLNLRATVSGSKLVNGRIWSATSSSNVLIFNLDKDGPALSDIAQKVKDKAADNDPSSNPIKIYDGVTTFKVNKQQVPVQILIDNSPKGTAEDFLRLVIPTQSVTVNVNYGGALTLVHAGAQLDYSKNSLTGKSSIYSSVVTVSSSTSSSTANTANVDLNCTFSNSAKTIQCNHSSTNGLVALTVATLTTDDTPIKSGATVSAIRKSYPAYFVDQTTGKRSSVSSSAALVVIFPALNTNQAISNLFLNPQEQYVNAAVVSYTGSNADDQIAIGLPNTTWNKNSGTLQGRATITISSGGAANLTLDCSNFLSTETTTSKAVFTCFYTSDQNGVNLEFVGTGK